MSSRGDLPAGRSRRCSSRSLPRGSRGIRRCCPCSRDRAGRAPGPPLPRACWWRSRRVRSSVGGWEFSLGSRESGRPRTCGTVARRTGRSRNCSPTMERVGPEWKGCWKDRPLAPRVTTRRVWAASPPWSAVPFLARAPEKPTRPDPSRDPSRRGHPFPGAGEFPSRHQARGEAPLKDFCLWRGNRNERAVRVENGGGRPAGTSPASSVIGGAQGRLRRRGDGPATANGKVVRPGRATFPSIDG